MNVISVYLVILISHHIVPTCVYLVIPSHPDVEGFRVRVLTSNFDNVMVSRALVSE